MRHYYNSNDNSEISASYDFKITDLNGNIRSSNETTLLVVKSIPSLLLGDLLSTVLIDSITLERPNCLLACNRFTLKHSYDRVAEMLYNILGEFSLRREQVVSTITDSGSNFVKAFK
ncbi:hypothetical protein QTP88_018844 [Uroleucon formosanum]